MATVIGETCVECDRCGATSRPARSQGIARRWAYRDGWYRGSREQVDGAAEWVDLCPDCAARG